MSNINSDTIIYKGKPKLQGKPILNFREGIQKVMSYITSESGFFIPIVVFFSLVALVVYEINTALHDRDPMSHLIEYVFLTTIPIIVIFSYISYSSFDKKTNMLFLNLVVSGLILFLIVYGFINLSNIKFNTTLNQIFYYGMILLIVVVGLSTFYAIFQNQLRTTDTWTSFWIEMIFYIPCMMDIFVKNIIKDYTDTSNRTIILFGIEVVLLIIYFYLYPMYKKSIHNNGVVIINKPVFLDSTHSNLITKLIDADNANKISPPYLDNPLHILLQPDLSTYSYRKNYAISMWVYVNPMPLNRIGYVKETNIFYYGYGGNSAVIDLNNSADTSPESSESPELSNYHPRLSMTQVEKNYVFNFYYSGSTVKHQLELPLQKWNNVLFNYVNNGVDVFINGELSLSYTFSDDIPIYEDKDDIFIGDTNFLHSLNDNGISMNTNGLYGAICNIVYYREPLKKHDIVTNYNLLMLNNPPIL